MKKIYLVKGFEIKPLEHSFETLEEAADTIPLELAITESGFPPCEWDRIDGKDVMTRREFDICVGKITAHRKLSGRMLQSC